MLKPLDAGLVLALGLVAGFGCNRAVCPALPPLPAFDSSKLEPAVRDQIAATRAALDADPFQAASNGALGELFHAYDRLEDAKICYRRATILDPGAFRWWYCLGRVLIDTGQRQEGIEAVRRAASLDASYVPAALFLGSQALEAEDLDEARRWIGIASRLEPSSPHVLAARGQIASREGQPQEAIRRFQEALALAPRFGGACYGLALAYRAAGDVENAQRQLELYSKLDRLAAPPDPVLEEIQARRRDADHVLRSANALMEKKDFAGAARRYEEVLALNPDLVMAEYDLGLALQRLNQPDKAAAHYESFLRRRPDSIDALNNLGLCFYETDRFTEAIERFQRAVEVDPGYAKGHFNLGLASARSGKPAEAIGHFERALSIRPRDAETHWSLGVLLQQAGRREEASSHFYAVLEASPEDERAQRQLLGELPFAPKDPRARRALAGRLEAKRLFRAAASVLERGARRPAGDRETAVELAWLLATCSDAAVRRPEEAARILEPICRGAGDDPRPFDALACALAASGRFDDAVKTAETALRLAGARSGDPDASRLADGIRARLELFKKGKPYLEP